MKSLVKNAADPEQVGAADEKEKSGRERELNDMAFILSTQRGRRFLWRLLSACGMFSTSFQPDPYLTAFNEGARNVGLPLFKDALEADQNNYFLMTEENANG